MQEVLIATTCSSQFENASAHIKNKSLLYDKDKDRLYIKYNDEMRLVGSKVDNAVDNLINYYKKSETYTKNEIDQKLSAKWDSKFVDELPTEDISTSTIYFLKRKKEQGTTQYENDVYDEYIYTGTWELIGNTYVDLSDYYTKSETNTQIQTQIGVESQARQDADSLLQTNIDNVQINLNTTNQNLNAEISAREVKNLQHETDISANTTAIQAERTRAMGAESTLADRCDTYDSHVTNEDNPHSVTAEQVGLGNVINVSTTDTITPNSEENITSGAVYTALKNKVDKIDGRGLSEQNFTYAEKTKLAGLKNYDDTSIQSRVSANESAIATLNGDSSTVGSVDKKIADAIAGVTQIDFKIVTELPSTGIKGTIYLIRGTGTEATQQYDEYIWVDDKWEKLGKSTIEVDLSDVYSKNEVNALVSVKNDKITITDDSSTALTDADTFSTTSNSGTNPTNLTKRPLSLLWNYIKSKADSVYAKLSHTHTKSQITDFPTSLKNPNALTVNGKTYDGSSAVDAGVQTVANGGTGATNALDAFENLADGVRDSSTPADNEKMLLKPSGTWYKTTCLDFWNYIKGKISSVLGLTKDNYGGTAKNATTAGTATTAAKLGRNGDTGIPMTFNWSGQGGQPSWLWGGNDGSNMYVYNPSNFSVNRASTAGTANVANYLFYTHTNEINFKGGAQATCYFNYRNADTDSSTPVNEIRYRFCNYSNTTSKSVIEAGSFFGFTAKALSKMVIPIGEPSSLEDGCIWIER